MKTSILTVLSALLALTSAAFAGELDPSAQVPGGLIVRVSEKGATTVFRVESKQKIASEATAQAAVAQFAIAKNEITSVRPVSELDRETSREAWYSWHAPYYSGYGFYPYAYTYWNTGYAWNYYPYYSWYTPSYSWYFYRW